MRQCRRQELGKGRLNPTKPFMMCNRCIAPTVRARELADAITHIVQHAGKLNRKVPSFDDEVVA